MKTTFAFAVLLLAFPAYAQQMSPEYAQRALDVVTVQRNIASNVAAAQQVRADVAEEKLAAVQKELDEARALAASRWWRRSK